MNKLQAAGLAALVACVAAGSAQANNNPWGGLNRAQERYNDAANKAAADYRQDTHRAATDYQRRAAEARERYHEAVSRMQRGNRWDYGEAWRAQAQYQNNMGNLGRQYSERTQDANRKYWERMQRAREHYHRDIQDQYRRGYDYQHRGRGTVGGIWDRITGRNRHYREWNDRYRYATPMYGYDHSQYYWNNQGYGYGQHNNGWRPYGPHDARGTGVNNRGAYQYRDYASGATYMVDRNGGTNYHYPHEDQRFRYPGGWNLSVGVGSHGSYGYVNYDPYTYGYNNRNSYNYYRSYRWPHNDLRWNNNSRGHFQFGGSSNYYGDSAFYGNLYFPF